MVEMVEDERTAERTMMFFWMLRPRRLLNSTSGRIIGTVLGGYAAMGLGVQFGWPRRTLSRQANSERDAGTHGASG